MKLSRIQLLISNLRTIKERLIKHIITEEDLVFLLNCGILTNEEYQRMNGNKQEQVSNKKYILHNDVH